MKDGEGHLLNFLPQYISNPYILLEEGCMSLASMRKILPR